MEKEILLARDKETKRTIRYAEVDTDEIGYAYVKKQLAAVLGSPEQIRLTIRAA